MPRNTRKQLVGKRTENCEIDLRAEELADLERSLHRAWRWCGNKVTPIWNDPNYCISRSNGRTNPKEADWHIRTNQVPDHSGRSSVGCSESAWRLRGRAALSPHGPRRH